MNIIIMPSSGPQEKSSVDGYAALIKMFKDMVYREKKSVLVVLTGKGGDGKSFSAVRFAEDCSERFNVNNVFWKIDDFITAMDTEGRLQDGDACVPDETSISLSSKEFYTKTNIWTGKVVDGMRYRRLFVFMTLPNFNRLDKGIRERMFGKFEAKGINRKTMTAEFKFNLIDEKQQIDKVYFPYARDGGSVIDPVIVPHPERTDMEEYQKRKHLFMKELTGDAIAEINKEKDERFKKTRSYKVTLGLVRKNPTEFIIKDRTGKTLFSREMIKELCKCSESTSRAVKIQMEREYGQSMAGAQ